MVKQMPSAVPPTSRAENGATPVQPGMSGTPSSGRALVARTQA
jgi:hypothetical protein